MKINYIKYKNLILGAFLLIGGSSVSLAGELGAPVALKGVLSPSGKAFTILWSTKSPEGAGVDSILGYNIYRRNSLEGESQKINSEPLTSTIYADRVDGAHYYYSVRAVDQNGDETADREMLDSSLAANRYFFNAMRDAYVRIPNTGGSVLEAPNNPFGAPVTVGFTETSSLVDGALIRQVALRFVRIDTMEDVTESIVLGDDDSEIHIRYLVVNGVVGRGSPAVFGQSVDALTNYSPQDLVVYWNNGISWIPMHSENRMLDNELVFNTSQGGVFQVRALSTEDGLTLKPENVYPKTITPNGDGLNDRVFFVLTNPSGLSFDGAVLDLAGRHITDLRNSNTGPSVGSTLVWTGTDAGGAAVPSGEYIYRINGGGQTYQGLVSVAR